MSDSRGSVFERGDLQFAQSREAVELTDPSLLARVQEGIRLEQECIRLQSCLGEAVEQGDQELIDEIESVYTRSIDAWSEWKKAGEEDGPDVPGYLSLRRALTETSEEEALDETRQADRVDSWSVFCAYVFQDGIANPFQAFKNFLAAVRRVSPNYLNSISQTDLGLLLDETKASPSAREIRHVEDILKKWGVTGFHVLGGTKSDKARRASAIAAGGNRNRSTGTKKKQVSRRREKRRKQNQKKRTSEKNDK